MVSSPSEGHNQAGTRSFLLALRGFDEIVAKRDDSLLHLGKFLRCQTRGLYKIHGQAFLPQAATSFRQTDQDLALVRWIALPAEVAHSLELLEDRCQRIGFEKQILT